MPLFAEVENDIGEVALGGSVNDVSRTWAFTAHPHVEGAIKAERESATGRIELHGGNAEIEHHSIDSRVARFARNRIEVGKSVLDQGQATVGLIDHVGTKRDGGLITVNADHFTIGRGENRAGVAARAEGAIDIYAALSRLEQVARRAAEHGNVEGRSASDS